MHDVKENSVCVESSRSANAKLDSIAYERYAMPKVDSPFTVRLDSKQAKQLTAAAMRAGGFDQLKASDVERIASAEASTDASTRPSKYRNVRTVVDGETFDSKKEAQYWHELKLREKNGEIHNLRRQVEFNLCCPNMCPQPPATATHFVTSLTPGAMLLPVVAVYIADFVFLDREDRQHVQDVKGGRATQTQLYKLKKKWLELQSGIVIEEV